jgi:hypothetical protein
VYSSLRFYIHHSVIHHSVSIIVSFRSEESEVDLLPEVSVAITAHCWLID